MSFKPLAQLVNAASISPPELMMQAWSAWGGSTRKLAADPAAHREELQAAQTVFAYLVRQKAQLTPKQQGQAETANSTVGALLADIAPDAPPPSAYAGLRQAPDAAALPAPPLGLFGAKPKAASPPASNPLADGGAVLMKMLAQPAAAAAPAPAPAPAAAAPKAANSVPLGTKPAAEKKKKEKKAKADAPPPAAKGAPDDISALKSLLNVDGSSGGVGGAAAPPSSWAAAAAPPPGSAPPATPLEKAAPPAAPPNPAQLASQQPTMDSMLAGRPVAEQKQMLGEWLFPVMHSLGGIGDPAKVSDARP